MMAITPTLTVLAAIQTAAVLGFLVWMVRRDKRRHEDMIAAIEYALGLDLFRQRQFLRLFIDGEQAALKRDYPEWTSFLTHFRTMEGY
ncbi:MULTISPECIES: hypothetical protein [unclassified Rhizobium]|uniref:hypothetical protein n=1 Tax=unclassified Rhizobium TaxID=2613769 RepID=UPI00160D9CD0|nr:MULTISPECIES: hypothetical protein [unclassified Rhizobium]MBB3297858.1 hypothetical protein [Rhizobium sp. BK112]MBB4177647.1 hypothetical protein [Rhizobium sp. BK109]